MIDRFHVIEDGVAILRLRGRRHRQVKIYRRGEFVFAGLGSDFIRLTRSGGTDDPNISCLGVEGEGVYLDNGFPKWKAPTKSKPQLVAGGAG